LAPDPSGASFWLSGIVLHPEAGLAYKGAIVTNAPEVLEEGFYWVIPGQSPPEIAYWERGE
jgi:hypothetical protein